LAVARPDLCWHERCLPGNVKAGLGRIVLLLATLSLTGCSMLNRDTINTYKTLSEDGKGDEETAAELEARGAKQLKKGNLDKAQELLQRALEASVSYGPAHNTLGSVFYQKHQLYLAAWEFQYAAKLMPQRYEPYNNLGLTFEKANRLEEAIAWYSRAWEVAPQSAEVIGNLARAKIKNGERDDTVTMLLSELLMVDDRPGWLEWAEYHLIRIRNQGVPFSEMLSEPPTAEPMEASTAPKP
jgi:tetratricopeptide (TPR) repeat protein